MENNAPTPPALEEFEKLDRLKDNMFILKTILRDETGQVSGVVAYDNGRKVFYSKSSFDPEKRNQVRWVGVHVQLKNGLKMQGKVNISTYDRLSDFLNHGSTFIPFADTTLNGAGGKFAILAKDDISLITPVDDERPTKEVS